MPPPNLQSSPQEDLSVVMGRFHAWDADRKKNSASSQGEGVRELSYEEALAYHNPRRPARSPLPPTHAASPASVAAPAPATMADEIPAQTADIEIKATMVERVQNSVAADPIPKRAGVQAGAVSPARKVTKPVVKAVHKAAPALKPEKLAATLLKTAVVAPRKTARRPAPEPATLATAGTAHKRARGVSAQSSAKASRNVKLSAKATKSMRKRVGSVVPAEARQSATFQGALAACLKEAPRRTARKATPENKLQKTGAQQASPAAHRSMQKNMKPRHGKKALAVECVQETVPRKPVESIARTISVNLRLSKAEHDRMRRGAEEADLSLATFIRESTLRFQIGREREKQKMLESGLEPGPEFGNEEMINDLLHDLEDDHFDRPITEPSGPGLLTRMKNFWLGRRLTAIA